MVASRKNTQVSVVAASSEYITTRYITSIHVSNCIRFDAGLL